MCMCSRPWSREADDNGKVVIRGARCFQDAADSLHCDFILVYHRLQLRKLSRLVIMAGSGKTRRYWVVLSAGELLH